MLDVEAGTQPAVPSPVEALFPNRSDKESVDRFLTQTLTDALERVQAGATNPTIEMDAFKVELAAYDFAEPRSLNEVCGWTIKSLEHGIVQMGNPRYFGLFNPGSNFPAQCADRISGAFNPQLASSSSSPVPVAIEDHVIQQVAKRAGLLVPASGHFATGGSEANATALICALTHLIPEFSELGVRGARGQPVFYTSAECHIAWLKVAHQTGIGRNALRLIKTDGQGRLDIVALEAAIAEDRARGELPVMIVATAGTTGAGRIDPLAACARLAEREHLWFHVDAAWGGAAIASKRLRPLLAGMELADSITIDAHKWFATTMGCAMFITTNNSVLNRAFHSSTSFMAPAAQSLVDPYLNSIQWSRRFIGLRMFLTLSAAGWEGLARHVERAVDLTRYIGDQLIAHGWKVVNDPSLAVLAALPPPHLGDARSLVRKVVASGHAWVAPTTTEGVDVVRICVTNGETTIADANALVNALNGISPG